MSKEPHAGGILDKYPYVAKSDVVGRIVTILDARAEERGLELVIHPSRAVSTGEIHELLATDDMNAAPGEVVDRVAYIAFFAVERGGVILVGDRVTLGGREVGRVAGFDMTHFPNHMNILLVAPEPKTGRQLEIGLGEEVVFAMGEKGQSPDYP